MFYIKRKLKITALNLYFRKEPLMEFLKIVVPKIYNIFVRGTLDMTKIL